MPWASLVVDFLKAKRAAAGGFITPLREFVTLRLAETWKESNHIDVESLVASAYEPTEKWEDETHRFLTVDCQNYLEEFWAVVAAWAQGGASRRLAFRRLTSFEEIEALQKEFNIAPQRVFLDVGYQREKVLMECGKRGWMGMRGEDRDYYEHSLPNGKPIKRVYSKPTRISSTGRTAPPVFRWSNPSVKDILHLLKTGRLHPWEVCDLGDLADDYARQTDSERKMEHTSLSPQYLRPVYWAGPKGVSMNRRNERLFSGQAPSAPPAPCWAACAGAGRGGGGWVGGCGPRPPTM
jgi:hypothetical protein